MLCAGKWAKNLTINVRHRDILSVKLKISKKKIRKIKLNFKES